MATKPNALLKDVQQMIKGIGMSVSKVLFITSFLGVSMSSSIAATFTDSLIQCNPQFFETLYQQRTALKKVVRVQDDHKAIAWVPVTDKEGTIAYFTHTFRDGDLTLSGYYEQSEDLGKLGKYYFWGVLIDEPVEKVIALTPEVKWQNNNGLYITHPQIKVELTQPWQPNPSAIDGIAPVKDSAEKVVMLSNKNGKSLLSCSIQGNIDRALLLQERPDIAAGNE